MNLKSRLANLDNSEAIAKNMSNNWGDILEELEVQTKELNEYVDKVSKKFNIDKEKLVKNMETDAECLRKRQKKINLGKVTPEYQRYILEVNKGKRRSYHPRTPNKFRRCSRRKFDGLIKKWRKQLHMWDEDPEGLKDFKCGYVLWPFSNPIITGWVFRFSIGESDKDLTDDFGGASNIDGSETYPYDILDVDIDENDLETSTK